MSDALGDAIAVIAMCSMMRPERVCHSRPEGIYRSVCSPVVPVRVGRLCHQHASMFHSLTLYSGSMHMKKGTGASVASKAGSVLANPASTPAERSAAASALTQHQAARETSSARAASAASSVLRNPASSSAEKSAAASTLSQRAK